MTDNNNFKLRMQQATSDNRRIAKNTLMLYMRMFLVMGVSLFTSREILRILGVEDFGIYNVVAGIVVLFSFINAAMTASTQRFLNFELGRGNTDEARKIFAASLNIYISIVIVFIILAETVGLWFLNKYINIPPGRMSAANWVYQATIVATALSFVRTPYNAAIIAYERMSFYAYTSIVEVVLKLVIIYILSVFTDKLIGYGWLLSAITLIMLIIYVAFCRKAFIICRGHTFEYDQRRYLSLISFSGWSLFGSLANVGASQGVNILLNIFLGVAVNAAIGVANQVNAAVYSFVSNFQTAFAPQIVKTYASGLKETFLQLLNNTARYSFLLLFVISYPIFMECEYILSLWLVDVPALAPTFTRLILLANMFDALSGPLWCAVQATGKIKVYQLIVSVLFISTLPLCYVALRAGLTASMVFGIKVLISAAIYVFRFLYVRQQLNVSLRHFITTVMSRIALIVAVSAGVGVAINWYNPNDVICIALYVFSATVLSVIIGLNQYERKQIIVLAANKLHIKKNF